MEEIMTGILPNTNFTNFHKVLNMESLNPRIKGLEYATTVTILTAEKLEKDLREGKKLSFNKITKATLGDCHAMGQKPITFVRQLLAACSYPTLIETNIFSWDVNKRAHQILSTINNSIGCYSVAAGLPLIKEHIAEFIQKRDGYHCNPAHLFITNGASAAIKLILEFFSQENEKVGVMVPVPQYLLYAATIIEFGMKQVFYYLNEEKNWTLEVSELRKSLLEARKTCSVKCLCVINPGNPTGQVLSYNTIKEVLEFAIEEGLFIIADEVYQENIYDGSTFHSFKKVLMDMGPVAEGFQLASLHSCSKGFFGECGLRAGYAEIVGVSDEVLTQLTKMQFTHLGANLCGQIVLDCLVHPPQKGEPSYELFLKEKMDILSSLNKRANLVYSTLNTIDGITCNKIQGALYAFPKITIPQKAIDKAKLLGLTPDSFYCLKLIEETGICTYEGSIFYQKEGTFHLSNSQLDSGCLQRCWE
ncbi:alanine aminotransferase 2-like isoform X4 [Hydra vulgaris]|uniref:alanine transaminase n=1 Tax=Hydra vulgaris TaxID=6087 RepID=A0ABM4CCY5_HYDVU